jgi:GNAT superfamily N-acetyltransferase
MRGDGSERARARAARSPWIERVERPVRRRVGPRKTLCFASAFRTVKTACPTFITLPPFIGDEDRRGGAGQIQSTDMDVRLRTATPCDAPALAVLIYLAAKSHYENSGYDISLGGSYEHQLEQIAALTVTEARSWFHCSHFVVAEMHGRIVAGAAGFDRIRTEAAIPAALMEIGWTPEAIGALECKLERLYAAFPDEPAGCWTVDHVAVLPDCLGMGLGRKVVERIVQAGIEGGYELFKLDVFAGNAIARRLYEAAGFEVTEVLGGDALRVLLGRDPIERMTMRRSE